MALIKSPSHSHATGPSNSSLQTSNLFTDVLWTGSDIALLEPALPQGSLFRWKRISKQIEKYPHCSEKKKWVKCSSVLKYLKKLNLWGSLQLWAHDSALWTRLSVIHGMHSGNIKFQEDVVALMWEENKQVSLLGSLPYLTGIPLAACRNTFWEGARL